MYTLCKKKEASHNCLEQSEHKWWLPISLTCAELCEQRSQIKIPGSRKTSFKMYFFNFLFGTVAIKLFLLKSRQTLKIFHLRVCRLAHNETHNHSNRLCRREGLKTTAGGDVSLRAPWCVLSLFCVQTPAAFELNPLWTWNRTLHVQWDPACQSWGVRLMRSRWKTSPNPPRFTQSCLTCVTIIVCFPSSEWLLICEALLLNFL